MYYIFFDTSETATYYNQIITDPDMRVSVVFPNGYYVTGEDIAALYRMNLSLRGILPS